MGVDRTIFGRLTSGGLIEDGGRLALTGKIHARAEPEIAFVMKRELSGPVTQADALRAVEAIAPAIEVIDSRYRDFKFALPDVIADNTSACGYVVGRWNSPRTDVTNLGMLLELDGRLAAAGSSAAILGNPWRALLIAARLMAEQEQALQPGWIVLAGSPVEAQALAPGRHVRGEVERLGRVEFTTAE
jgi:2-oxo-3-hexenedioate decarboxylase